MHSNSYHIFGDKGTLEMAMHGVVGPFDPQSEDWVLYIDCLQQWFVTNDVQDANKQCAVLLSMCGALTYQLIRNLVTPSKPMDLNFKELVSYQRCSGCKQAMCSPPQHVWCTDISAHTQFGDTKQAHGPELQGAGQHFKGSLLSTIFCHR